jgi:hypothetical protein
MSGVPLRVVSAAASDYVSGKEVLALLLNDQAKEVPNHSRGGNCSCRK